MRNPSQRQSQSSHHQNLSSVEIEIRFQILSNVSLSSLELAPGRRIYLSGSVLPAASSESSPASRNRAIPLVPRFLNFRSIRSHGDCTELRRCSYLPENDAAAEFGCKCGSGSARLGATCCTSSRS